MQKLLQILGRSGHIALQVALMGAQGYAAYLNGGKAGAANFAIAAIQVWASDAARVAPPPVKPQDPTQ